MDTEQQQQQKKKNVPFPLELMEKVLLRSPVKSLVRFRSLSKHSLSLLTDPQFIKSHSDLGAAPTNALLTIYPGTSKARWVDLDAPILCHHVVSLPVPRDSELTVIDSCRGFVMLHHAPFPRGPILLWNPLTGLHKHVPYPSAASRSLRCGFGYDESTDDYLVVVVRRVTSAPRWQFFSVRTSSWNELEITHSPRLISTGPCPYGYGLFFNGAIHWLATTEHDGVRSKVIIALDLAERSISEMLLPDFEEGDLGNLVVVGGCLGMCHHWKLGHHKVWVMKEYKLHTTWTKHCTDAIVPKCSSIAAVRFTPTLLSLPGDFEATRSMQEE